MGILPEIYPRRRLESMVLAGILAAAAPAAWGVNLVYTDHTCVDLYVLNSEDISSATSNLFRKVMIYRGPTLIHTAVGTNLCATGYSDQGVSRGQRYAYTSVVYRTNSAGEWVRETDTPPRIADTSYCRGQLNNAPDNPFGRPPRVWSGAVALGGAVWVEAGVLRILPGATVDMNRRYAAIRTLYPSGELDAVGATFENTNGWFETGFLKLGHRAMVRPSVSNCLFRGVWLATASSSEGVALAGNRFIPGAAFDAANHPMLWLGGAGHVVTGNVVAGASILVEGIHHVLAGNSCATWRLTTSNSWFVANRDTNGMEAAGDNNRFVSNTSFWMRVSGHGNTVEGNTLGPLDSGYGALDLKGARNLVVSNTLAGNYVSTLLSLRYGGCVSNTVVGNHLLGRCNDAIYTASDSRGNLIYDNYIGSRAFHYTQAEGVGNRWSIPKTAGLNIVGGPYRGGNYWARHGGTDADGDGLYDEPLLLEGSAGARDERPLVGPGEVLVSAADANPAGAIVAPHGKPFAVTRLTLRATGTRIEPARVTGMTFRFHGDPGRMFALAGAGLLAGATPDESAMQVLATAAFRSNRVTFAFDDPLPDGRDRFYSLVYGFRYEDEYTTAGPLMPDRRAVGEIRFGGETGPDAIVCHPARVVGDSVVGYIRPVPSRYIVALPAPVKLPLGKMIENTAEVLAVWSLWPEICADQNPAVWQTWTLDGQPAAFWIKDGGKVHLLSAFANRPMVRVHPCQGPAREARSLPVSELLDATLVNGRPRWARGLGYANPYQYEDLLFAGEIDLHATAAAGNYKGFKRDVLVPLRAAFGEGNVILAQFRHGAQGGYYGFVRVRTRKATQRALAVLAGRPRVLHQAGRQLMVKYETSVGGNPAPDEQILDIDAPGTGVPPADYDGDGVPDPVVFDAESGGWTLWLSGRGYAAVAFGGGGPDSVPAPADYDGDGLEDPASYLAAAGAWRVWLSGSGYREVSVAGWGGPDFTAHPADYDGDGKADPAVYAEAGGLWRVWLSGAGYREASVSGWGGAGYAAYPADYDGDGKSDPAVYAEAGGLWRIWLSGAGYREVSVGGWGAGGIVAAPADYDGDRKTDPAVFDPASGRRRAWRSGSGYTPLDL